MGRRNFNPQNVAITAPSQIVNPMLIPTKVCAFIHDPSQNSMHDAVTDKITRSNSRLVKTYVNVIM